MFRCQPINHEPEEKPKEKKSKEDKPARKIELKRETHQQANENVTIVQNNAT